MGAEHTSFSVKPRRAPEQRSDMMRPLPCTEAGSLVIKEQDSIALRQRNGPDSLARLSFVK